MELVKTPFTTTVSRDLISGLVVFLVALPLCLGIALASNAPLFSGVVAGIVGGIVVGILSGSHSSVSGPAAGLTVIVAAQIARLGTFEAFLLAVVVAGVIQISLGLLKAGFLSAFVPSSVINGLLAAIGVILILKQIPHVLGHDTDPEGEMAFQQPDHENTLSELFALVGDLHYGAVVVGLFSVVLLLAWGRIGFLKRSVVPAPLIVVLMGVFINQWLQPFGSAWAIGPKHLVQVPIAENLSAFLGLLRFPDFTQWTNPAIYQAGLTIAIVASLETLLNLEAVDKLDPKRRSSPASRELFAQGCGNVVAGCIGGIPVTSVIVRSSVNLHSGAETKFSAVFHGILLVVSVAFLPVYLNMIPLASLAAILLVTGLKLASPELFKKMWNEGHYQFAPFLITLVAIVFTDLLVGIVIGLAVSTSFILYSNLRRPVRRYIEKHLGDEVLRIELASQVSFLNRAALNLILQEAPRGSHVLLDASHTHYIDPDILSLIRDFKESIAPARGIRVSLSGFRDKYHLDNEIQFVDYSTRELQDKSSPTQILQMLREGNERFRAGRCLTRNLGRQLHATAAGQHPLAVILSCIDSRTPSELVLDLGLGDIFTVRVAGNVLSPKVLGSMEFGCALAGAKLIVVMGHTRCGAVNAAVNMVCSDQLVEDVTGCRHLAPIVADIQKSIDVPACRRLKSGTDDEKKAYADIVATENVQRVVEEIVTESETLRRLVEEGRIAIVGAVYDVASGGIEFLTETALGLNEEVSETETV